MAGKVISVEIGAELTKVCYLDYKAKNTKVYHAFVFETPEGTVEDGYIKNAEGFCDVFAAKLAAADIKEKKVVFSISSSKIANREVEFPLVSRDKIMPMVRANIGDYFPVDLKSYHISYTILEKIMTKEEKKMKLLLLAAPLDLLESYFDLARMMSMSIQSIDYSGNSIFQIVKDMRTEGTNICIHINEKNTIISILENGVLALQRTVSYGADSAIETIMSIDKYRYDDEFTEDKAIDLLLSKQMINTVMSEGGESQADLSEDEKERNEITDSLRYLLGNITRVIDYYMTKTSGSKVDMIYLSGIGAEFVGLRELFSFEIGSNVKVLNSLTTVSYSPKEKRDSIPIMLVAIGASKNPMNLMPDELKTKKVKKVSLVVPTVVLLAGIVLSVGMYMYGQIAYSLEAGTRDKLKQELADMDQYKQINEQYTGSKTVYEQIKEMYESTDNMNQYLVAFIEELEEKMPDSFEAAALNVSETGLSFGVTVKDKTAVAEVIQQLRTFETISVISVSGISTDTEEEAEYDENGELIEKEDTDEEENENSKIAFTVSLLYNMDYGVEETTAAK